MEQIARPTHELARQFVQQYGVKPLMVEAPGRVNLTGEHTDYNDGFVLRRTIHRTVRGKAFWRFGRWHRRSWQDSGCPEAAGGQTEEKSGIRRTDSRQLPNRPRLPHERVVRDGSLEGAPA
jgi:hypothetical protein